jgi:membrane protease YdiL (CAAX protease family)
MADTRAPIRSTATPRSPVTGALARRTTVALVSTIVGLAIFNVARAHVIDTAAGVATNLLMAAALAGVAGYATLRAAELGTERSRVPAGLRLGGAALLAVAVAVVGAACIPALSGAMVDDRVDVGPVPMLVHVLVTIPLGTVVLEELAFRGLLLGLLRRVTTTTWAVVADSVLFGLWHVAPAIVSAGDNATLAGVSSSPGGLVATVVATVLTTTGAGLVFCWLRLRSRSIVAPALAHIATNSVTFAVAWAVAAS